MKIARRPPPPPALGSRRWARGAAAPGKRGFVKKTRLRKRALQPPLPPRHNEGPPEWAPRPPGPGKAFRPEGCRAPPPPGPRAEFGAHWGFAAPAPPNFPAAPPGSLPGPPRGPLGRAPPGLPVALVLSPSPALSNGVQAAPVPFFPRTCSGMNPGPSIKISTRRTNPWFLAPGVAKPGRRSTNRRKGRAPWPGSPSCFW